MNKSEFIRSTIEAPVFDKEFAIVERCINKSVLDVGCVGQDKFYDAADWLHRAIKSKAREIHGVDINLEPKKILAEQGYTLLSAEELSSSNKKYEVVVIGDVIEHVDDINSFLRFYLNCMEENGEMIITTPNPFSIRQFSSIFLYKKPGINPEHTSFLDPNTLAENFARLSVKIKFFCWLHEYSKPKKKRYKILFPIFRILYNFRKFWSPNFMFVICKK